MLKLKKKHWVARLLFPSFCAGCLIPGVSLCTGCGKKIQFSTPRCAVCRKESPFGMIHSWCRNKIDTRIVGIYSFYMYAQFFSYILSRVKMKQDKELLLDTLDNVCLNKRIELHEIQGFFKGECFTYIPQNTKSKTMPLLTKTIAQWLGQELQLPVVNMLFFKQGYIKKQSQIPRNRRIRTNRIIKYGLSKKAVDKYSRLYVVDDVVTSGGTMFAAVRALQKASKHIYGIVFAQSF